MRDFDRASQVMRGIQIVCSHSVYGVERDYLLLRGLELEKRSRQSFEPMEPKHPVDLRQCSGGEVRSRHQDSLRLRETLHGSLAPLGRNGKLPVYI